MHVITVSRILCNHVTLRDVIGNSGTFSGSRYFFRQRVPYVCGSYQVRLAICCCSVRSLFARTAVCFVMTSCRYILGLIGFVVMQCLKFLLCSLQTEASPAAMFARQILAKMEEHVLEVVLGTLAVAHLTMPVPTAKRQVRMFILYLSYINKEVWSGSPKSSKVFERFLPKICDSEKCILLK